MLKVIIHNELKCFPFEDIESAQKMLETVKSVNPDSVVAKLNEETLDLYVKNSPYKDLFIVVSERKERKGFYDKDSYVFIPFDEPFYTIL